jgi:hypothetical protein
LTASSRVSGTGRFCIGLKLKIDKSQTTLTITASYRIVKESSQKTASEHWETYDGRGLEGRVSDENVVCGAESVDGWKAEMLGKCGGVSIPETLETGTEVKVAASEGKEEDKNDD